MVVQSGRGALPSIINVSLHKTIKPLLFLPAKIQTAALLSLRGTESRVPSRCPPPSRARGFPSWGPRGTPPPPVKNADFVGIIFLGGRSCPSLVRGTRVLAAGQVCANRPTEHLSGREGCHGTHSSDFSASWTSVSPPRSRPQSPFLPQRERHLSGSHFWLSFSFLAHFRQPLPLKQVWVDWP